MATVVCTTTTVYLPVKARSVPPLTTLRSAGSSSALRAAMRSSDQGVRSHPKALFEEVEPPLPVDAAAAAGAAQVVVKERVWDGAPSRLCT